MHIKKGIETRQDIKLLVDKFYDKVRVDPVIGFFFNDIAKVNWDHHLPVLYDFWEANLLGTRVFKGNPLAAHLQLNQLEPMQKQHFERWLQLFFATVDEYFEGDTAEEANLRAKNIAALMEYKINSKI